MNAEVTALMVESGETVLSEGLVADSFLGSYTNVLNTPLVVESIDIAALGNGNPVFGFLAWLGTTAPFFYFNGDSSSSGGLWRQWTGKLVLLNGQGIAWDLESSDASTSWGIQVSGHWELAYRPSF